MLGRSINNHFHRIFCHDLLAAHLTSRLSNKKKRVSVGSLGSEIALKTKWYYQPLQIKLNSIPTNHDSGWVLRGFALMQAKW